MHPSNSWNPCLTFCPKLHTPAKYMRVTLSRRARHVSSSHVPQEIRSSSLVHVVSVHPHTLASYDAFGNKVTGGTLLVVLLEFCAGGSLQHQYLGGSSDGSGRRDSGERSYHSLMNVSGCETDTRERIQQGLLERLLEREVLPVPLCGHKEPATVSPAESRAAGHRRYALEHCLEDWVRQVKDGIR